MYELVQDMTGKKEIPSPHAKPNDDYEWASYTDIYSNQQITDKTNRLDVLLKDAKIVDGEIDYGSDNPEAVLKEILDKVLQLKPKSVFECGTGMGHFLYSVHQMFPDLEVGGIDLLQTQLDFGKSYLKIPEEFYNNIKVMSWIEPEAYKKLGKQYEFVYSNAVMMHLNSKSAIEFIKNMVGISSKYIFMHEGLRNFEDDFRAAGILDQFTPHHFHGTHGQYMDKNNKDSWVDYPHIYYFFIRK